MAKTPQEIREFFNEVTKRVKRQEEEYHKKQDKTIIKRVFEQFEALKELIRLLENASDQVRLDPGTVETVIHIEKETEKNIQNISDYHEDVRERLITILDKYKKKLGERIKP